MSQETGRVQLPTPRAHLTSDRTRATLAVQSKFLTGAREFLVGEGFQDYETVAGCLMYRRRKVPKRTDCVTYVGYKVEVVDIDNYRIDQVLVTRENPVEAV